MSQYTIVTNFGAKDSLISGNPLKAIKGVDYTTEFTAVQTALNSKFDGSVQFAPDGTAGQPSFGFTNNAGTGMYNTAGVLGFATNSIQRISVAVAGNVTVNAPASGIAFTAVGLAGQPAIQAQGPATANSGLIQFYDTTNTTNRGYMGGGGLITGQGVADIGIAAVTGNVLIGRAAGSAIGTTFGPSGNVTIAAPSSGTTLAISNAVGSVMFQASDGTQTYQTYTSAGNVWFGATSNSQVNFLVNNAAKMTLDTSGNVNVPNGAGSLSPVYAGIPQNAQNGATYSLVLSDANKHIYFTNTTATWTIPANASVAFPVGTAITLVNLGSGNITLQITTDSLFWIKGGTNLTGTRTIAGSSQVTLLKVTATAWTLTGNGIT